MDTVTPVNPSTVAADPTDDECPRCEATVQAWTCAACGLDFACTAVHPALSIVGLLPTPQLRTAAFLAILRTEVERLGKGVGTMTVILCLPATEVISIDAMASVDTVVWWCRLCDHHGTRTTRPTTAHSEGIEHLTTQHHATIGTAPKDVDAPRGTLAGG